MREWDQAYQQLLTEGEFTKPWFDAHMPRSSKEGSCNFTTIGGMFTLLGIAAYEGNGVYRKIGDAFQSWSDGGAITHNVTAPSPAQNPLIETAPC